MTRHELNRLQQIANALPTRPEMAAISLEHVIRDAEAEFAAEDQHNDWAELDTNYPNHQQAAE